MKLNLAESLRDIIPEERILLNEPMSKHTTFRTGGKADYFVLPETKDELSRLIRFLNEDQENYFILGNGSNLLVSDSGYRGVIIRIMNEFSDIEIKGTEIHAEAGALLSKIADTAFKNSLGGFEFASGIPGTAGGAMVMNAGAYGGEMKDVVRSVEVLTPDGEYLTLDNKEMEFSYRNSIVRKKGLIVLKVILSLEKRDPQLIQERMEELSKQRKEKQPLEFPSAGSTFKRPEGHFAGKLIMDAGLRGFSIGGAEVSEKHCGFIINKGGATSSDIYSLIKEVQKTVSGKFGVSLEPEVCMIGEF